MRNTVLARAPVAGRAGNGGSLSGGYGGGGGGGDGSTTLAPPDVCWEGGRAKASEQIHATTGGPGQVEHTSRAQLLDWIAAARTTAAPLYPFSLMELATAVENAPGSALIRLSPETTTSGRDSVTRTASFAEMADEAESCGQTHVSIVI